MRRQKAGKQTKSQMVRLPVDLLAALAEAGKGSSRSVPKEAEYRLRESLSRSGAAPALSPWARAVSDTVARLALELEEIGTGPEVRFGMLSDALAALFRELRPADSRLNKDDEDMVRSLVTYLTRKIQRDRGGILEGLEK
jgi:hypothetical protein